MSYALFNFTQPMESIPSTCPYLWATLTLVEFRSYWWMIEKERPTKLSDSHRVCDYLRCSDLLLRFEAITANIFPTIIMPSARVVRDIKARHGVRANEIARRAYLFVARNETLSPQVRHHAQLQLNTFGRYTRPTTVKNRCVESGRGRGIISEFGLSRVRADVSCMHYTADGLSIVPIPS